MDDKILGEIIDVYLRGEMAEDVYLYLIGYVGRQFDTSKYFSPEFIKKQIEHGVFPQKHGNSWIHCKSNEYLLGENRLRTSDYVDSRCYINIEMKQMEVFCLELSKRLQAAGFPIYYKYDILSRRADQICIYFAKHEQDQYLDILSDIIKDHAYMLEYLREPPLLTDKIIPWAGFAEEPIVNKVWNSGTESFNDLRAKIFKAAIDRTFVQYLVDHYQIKSFDDAYVYNLLKDSLAPGFSINGVPLLIEQLKDNLLKETPEIAASFANINHINSSFTSKGLYGNIGDENRQPLNYRLIAKPLKELVENGMTLEQKQAFIPAIRYHLAIVAKQCGVDPFDLTKNDPELVDK